MKHMLMIYADIKVGAALPKAEMDRWMEKMAAYQAALTKAGVFVETAALSPPWQATTVHLENDEMQIQDGPYAETREQLGGFYVIDVPDMATAQHWASQCPGVIWGRIEIRAFAER